MNQVPWRRILERAGDEGPGERGASVINLRDHAPDRQQNRRRPADGDPSNLESELQQALSRAQRKEREQVVARQAPPRSRRDAPEARSAPMLRPDLAMQRQPGLAVPLPPQQKSTSGARNFLAISLSAAVIGFALYQVSDQWKAMNDGRDTGQAAASPEETFASAQMSTGAGASNSSALDSDARQRTASFDGNRLDMRPSFAGEARTAPARAETTRQAALDRDIAEAAQVIARGEPKRSEAVQPAAAAANDEGMEQIMLRRGHDMVKNGRVESARLLFEHLAEQKSALGAFALAQTYDVKFLKERGISDVAPDQKLAAEWYQRAAELTMASVR